MEPRREIISSTQGKVFSDGVFFETSLLLVLGFKPRESRALLLVVNVIAILDWRLELLVSHSLKVSSLAGPTW